MLIRSLNSIYLQAPYVKEKADILDLLQYSLFWQVARSRHLSLLSNITGRNGSSEFTKVLISPLLKPTSSSEHHEGEETVLFPEIEKITGETGIMEKNIEQHHAFLPGLEAWTKYISECRKNEGSEFDAARFTKLIDGFAPQLTTHLAEEIPTLLALDKYNIAEVKRAWGLFDKAMLNKADVVCFNQLFFWVTSDKYSGRLIRWA
jgi:hypothetical protein